MKKEDILNKSLTDWDRIDALTDEEIDFSDCSEITPEMFEQAVVRRGSISNPKKEKLSLQVDSDVAAWFKEQGQGYQSRINALLRAYMDAHQRTQ
ncbi:MAG: hypothetical protein C4527_10405 [Candidatus Omnitrophota bacterium]|jgi:uncharacterized protein (DUF4415 family)|nr:MAG: hypothetical protein C4527_10405 [Candidatus Omnitrophota bacterium]